MSNLLKNKRYASKLEDALDGAASHLTSGAVQNQVKELFAGEFGDSPELEITIKIRRDPATDEQFTYKSKTRITHPIGNPVQLHGLKL
jgi:hypothetical protein